MRKFIANYLVSDSGIFLKNGIVVAGDDGIVVEYVDTKGDLRETEQLIFHSGILMAGFQFTKNNAADTDFGNDQLFRSFVLQAVAGSIQISIQGMIDLVKLVQVQYPEMKIPAILNEISAVLLTYGGFVKENIPGIYLLSGADLVGLHFISRSKLRKIL